MFFVYEIFLHSLSQKAALLRNAKLIFLLTNFFVSEYNLFRISLNFSASFWTVFVEPGAAPSLNTKSSLAKLLCSTSRILFLLFNCFDILKLFVGVIYSFRARYNKKTAKSASPYYICLKMESSIIFSGDFLLRFCLIG